MSECYGCGKKLPNFGDNGYFWVGGKQRTFCHGRYHQPKRACVTKAIFKLSEEHLCPLCGGEWSNYGEPCSDCEETLKVGRETRATTANLRDEILSEILASFLRFDSWSSGDMAWPFRIVTRRGDDQHSLSFQLRKAVHDLWMKWGELHHAKGLAEGSNMLTRLSTGETSLVEYNALRETAVENIPVARHGTEKLALQVVEAAKKIREWNMVFDPATGKSRGNPKADDGGEGDDVAETG